MFHRIRVLVVEASRELADNLVELLGTLGYRADRADSGAEALRLAGSHRYDCVVLDAVLPDVDSTELIRQLRLIDRAQRVVVMAAMLDSHTAQRVELAGASSVIRSIGSDGFLRELSRELRPARSIGGVRSTRSGWNGRRRAPSGLR